MLPRDLSTAVELMSAVIFAAVGVIAAIKTVCDVIAAIVVVFNILFSSSFVGNVGFGLKVIRNIGIMFNGIPVWLLHIRCLIELPGLAMYI